VYLADVLTGYHEQRRHPPPLRLSSARSRQRPRRMRRAAGGGRAELSRMRHGRLQVTVCDRLPTRHDLTWMSPVDSRMRRADSARLRACGGMRHARRRTAGRCASSDCPVLRSTASRACLATVAQGRESSWTNRLNDCTRTGRCVGALRATQLSVGAPLAAAESSRGTRRGSRDVEPSLGRGTSLRIVAGRGARRA